MLQRKLFCLLALALPAAGAFGQPTDVAALLRKCSDVQASRWAGVTHYVVDQSMMGNRVAIAYERFEAPGPDGLMHPAFRPVRSESQLASHELRTFAGAADSVGEGLANEMNAAGFPAGLLGDPGTDPWASTDPRVMMGGASTFLRAAADAQEANQKEQDAAAAEAAQATSHMAEFARRAQLAGAETIEGISATHIRAEGLNRQLSDPGGGGMIVTAVSLWIDAQQCVPLKLAIDGTLTADGQTRPISIERIDSRYATVAGSSMYEPYRQVMRMRGILTAAQQREMGEAQAKLADLETRLKQMPPGQRDMVMRQMGPQIATMKGMASGGTVEVVIDVHSILVNPDAAALQRVQAQAGPGAGAAASLTMTGATQTAAAPVPAQQREAPPSARQACLEEKIRSRKAAETKQRGMGRLLGAAGRIAGRLGGADVSALLGDAYATKTEADELAAAARDLGLTESEIAACAGAG